MLRDIVSHFRTLDFFFHELICSLMPNYNLFFVSRHMGPLKSMNYGSLIKAIYKFTMVRQNYGKFSFDLHYKLL